MSYEDELRTFEEALARIQQLHEELDGDPEHAPDLLEEMAERAKEATAAIERARRAAETEAAAPPSVDAPPA